MLISALYDWLESKEEDASNFFILFGGLFFFLSLLFYALTNDLVGVVSGVVAVVVSGVVVGVVSGVVVGVVSGVVVGVVVGVVFGVVAVAGVGAVTGVGDISWTPTLIILYLLSEGIMQVEAHTIRKNEKYSIGRSVLKKLEAFVETTIISLNAFGLFKIITIWKAEWTQHIIEILKVMGIIILVGIVIFIIVYANYWLANLGKNKITRKVK